MLPARVRQIIYILTAVVTPIVAYLGDQGKLDTFWVGLVAVVISAVTALAAYNVDTAKVDQ